MAALFRKHPTRGVEQSTDSTLNPRVLKTGGSESGTLRPWGRGTVAIEAWPKRPDAIRADILTVVTYRVSDARRAVSTVDDVRQALYREARCWPTTRP